MTIFSEAIRNRNLNMLLRVSKEERAFLRREAARRGVKVATLVREALRALLPVPASPKQDASPKQSDGE